MSKISVGDKFSRWTVLEFSGPDSKYRKYWKCQCDCGTIRNVRGTELNYGQSRSCGCYQKEIARNQQIKNNKDRALPVGEASFNDVYLKYKTGAIKRNLCFSLSKEEFRNITSLPCVYCGMEPNHVYTSLSFNGEYVFTGIDRVDNNEGYAIENCVPCCKNCNYAKKEMSVSEFKDWITRVYNHFATVTFTT